jgi:glycosyltransferase involved in cell wall biosynthesis
MKIAIIGIRGIPIIYSGFESFITNLAPDLVKKGFRVIVYCRSHYVKRKIRRHKGVNLIYLPTLQNKYLETFIHSLFATIHACLITHPRVIYYLGVGNAPFVAIARLLGIKTLINVDGLDWKRKKWNWFGHHYLRFCQWLATKLAHVVITDSLFMRDYYKNEYSKDTVYIPYGFYPKFKENPKILTKYNHKKNQYFVWVGRIVPDNHLEELLEAFIRLKTNYKCVIIGDSYYEEKYKSHIYSYAEKDKRIVFTGFLSRDNYATLVKNAFCYVETKKSGGTHPSFIEAQGWNGFVLPNDYLINNKFFKKNRRLIYQNKENTRRKFNKNKILKNYVSLFKRYEL